MTSQPAPVPVPTPPDFPVAWDHPDDARMLWTFGRMWLPNPITPADIIIARHCFEHGLVVAATAYELLLRGHTRRINTHFYYAIAPLDERPGEREARERRSFGKLRAAMAHLREDWDSRWLPEIKRFLAEWQAFDLRGTSMDELLAHLDATLARNRRLYEIDLSVIFPSQLAIGMFDDLYRDLFDSESPVDAYALLQGFGSKTVETGRALWRLSRGALASPPVRRVLEETPAAEVPAALQRTPEGRAFWDQFRAYLAEYGQRGDTWAISDPSWIEDPTPIIRTLQSYVTQPDRDLEAEMAALAAERERRVAEARERLRGHPQAVRDEFEFLLRAAQGANVVSEDDQFYVDFCGGYQLRRVLLEFGRRFAEAGVLDCPEDIFYLELDEVRETAEHLPVLMVSPSNHRRSLVAARRAEMARFSAVTPPPVLGAMPAGPPPQDPLSRAMAKFFGPPPPPPEPTVLYGNPAARGAARGQARVLRSLAEAARLRPGDILVAETTAPPWTPLFATAAAVVTEVGGVLSHAAIVAREYGIPAVVGVPMATSRIADGQVVEVDGTAGVVRIVLPEAPPLPR